MNLIKNDLVDTPRGRGVVETPMEETCLVKLLPSINPDAKPPCEFVIFNNNEIRKVEE